MKSNDQQSSISSTNLVDIQAVPDPYRNIFNSYPSFNRVQSTVFHDVLYTDQSIALSAPTGSGKTVIFELAITRQLIAIENSKYSNIFKIVYISPLKALCEERLIDWHKKFSPLGVQCISITGDSDFVDFHSISSHNLIITTPEKWDSITRKWKENKKFIQVVKLFMIDEVHLLNEENRGATLEALVCRMKTIQSSIHNENENDGIYLKQNIRFLAASATFPNIKDLGEWLCGAKVFSFESNIRPVKLNTIVLGYSYNKACTPFKFDMTLNYKLPALIMKYSNGKPTLIFCSTRKSVDMAAKQLTQTLTIPLNAAQTETLKKVASSINDAKLKSAIIHGVGFHHGGLLPETRAAIEQLFRTGGLPVLITTSTLATGVNLPAHLVIIKSTKFYDKGGFQDYTAIALLQMVGRAGRPQFDTEATALILTTNADREKFTKMIDGKQDIESNLHRHLTEHLNAEIVLKTITDLDVAMRWLSSTFLYIRARENPRYYGIPLGLTSENIDKKLLEVCQIDLNKLVKAGMASMDEDTNINSTHLGILMAKYYISFETMKLFGTINGNEILQQILALISKCQEFSDMRLRVDEKKCLNLLNKNKNTNSIRYPINGKIKTLDMKINCTIQAIFGCLEIEDHSILSEAVRIMRHGERICRWDDAASSDIDESFLAVLFGSVNMVHHHFLGLIEYMETRTNCYTALLNSILLWKCFRAQLWENSPHVAKQFPGIGLVTSNQLVNAGKTSFEKLLRTNPREIEMITKRKPPFGNKIIDMANTIPRYDMKLEKMMKDENMLLKISITLINPESLEESPVVSADSIMCLLVGDNCNNILLYERYMHSFMLENTNIVRFVIINTYMGRADKIYAHFISENMVGIDLNDTFIVNIRVNAITQGKNAPNKKVGNSKTGSKCTNGNAKSAFKQLDAKYTNFVQTYMDNYLKCRKNISKQTDHSFMNPNSEHVSLGNSSDVTESRPNDKIKPLEETSTNYRINTLKTPNKNDQKKNIQKNDNEDSKFKRNSIAPSDNFYNLSSFDQTLSSSSPVLRSKINNTQKEKTPVLLCSVESHSDEDIPEHIMVLLDENQKNEYEIEDKNSDVPKTSFDICSQEEKTDNHSKNCGNELTDEQKCPEKEDTTNNAKIKMTANIIMPNIEHEFEMLCNKYQSNIQNSKVYESIESSNVTKENKSSGEDARFRHEGSGIFRPIKSLIKNKGKIHSAQSFENTLFNPNSNSLKHYRYQPTKRYSHNPQEVATSSTPQVKRQKLDSSNTQITDDVMKNYRESTESNQRESQYSKSIKWRSPLVYSPPVKYSPKISTSFSFSIPMPVNTESDTSHDWSLNTTETNFSSKNVKGPLMRGTPRRENNQSSFGSQVGSKFLLADKEYENDQITSTAQMNDTQSSIVSNKQNRNRSLQIEDIVSSSFLEEIGVSRTPRLTSTTQCFTQKPKHNEESRLSIGAYYKNLVANTPEIKENKVSPLHSSQVIGNSIPFFLNQDIKLQPQMNMNNSVGSSSFNQRNTQPNYQTIENASSPRLNRSFVTPHNMNQQYSDYASPGMSNNNPIYLGASGMIPSIKSPISPDFNNPYSHIPPNMVRFGVMDPSRPNICNNPEMSPYSPTLRCEQMRKDIINDNHHEYPNYLMPTNRTLMNNSSLLFREQYNRKAYDRAPFESQLILPQLSQNNSVDQSLHRLPIKQGMFNSFGENVESTNDDQRNFGTQESSPGFYLNQDRLFFQRNQQNVPSTWHNMCERHRVLNCQMCLVPPYYLSQMPQKVQHPLPSNNITTWFFNGRNELSVPTTFDNPFTVQQNFLKQQETFIEPPLAQYNQQYSGNTNPDQSQRFTNQSGTFFERRLSSNEVIRNHQFSSNNFQNPNIFNGAAFTTRTENKENVPEEVSKSQMFSRGNSNQQNGKAQTQNSSFIMDKFLHSFENSKEDNRN